MLNKIGPCVAAALLACLPVVSVTAAIAQEGVALDADRIMKEFVGRQVIGKTADGHSFTWTWWPDSTGEGMIDGKAAKGFYKLEGNEFCSGPKPDKTDNCANVMLMPKGVVHLLRGKKNISSGILGGTQSYRGHLLAGRDLKTANDLRAAATELGLVESPKLRGYVDKLSLLPGRSIRLQGWVLDLSGDGSPVSIVVFARGKSLPIVQSSGQRPDVRRSFKLTNQQSANLAFAVSSGTPTGCLPIKSLMVVAITKNDEYFQLPFWDKAPPCK